MNSGDELDRDDAVILLGSVPERLADLTAGLDENRLRYRHAPAFPTLLELVTHLGRAGAGVDGLLRQVQINGVDRLDVRRAIDPEEGAVAEVSEPGVPPAPSPISQVLDDFARVRRRSVDLLRGMGPAAWERTIADAVLGPLTMLDVVRLVTRHELGHLGQVRNLIAVLPEPEDLGPLDGA